MTHYCEECAGMMKARETAAANAAIEECAVVVDSYADNICNRLEPGQHARTALTFVATHIRALKREG